MSTEWKSSADFHDENAMILLLHDVILYASLLSVSHWVSAITLLDFWTLSNS